VRQIEGFVFVEAMFGNQPGKKRAVNAPCNIVPRGGENGVLDANHAAWVCPCRLMIGRDLTLA